MGTRMCGHVEAVDKEKTALHVLNVPQTVFPICMTWTKFPGADHYTEKKMGPGGPFFTENFGPGDQNLQDQNSGDRTTALSFRSSSFQNRYLNRTKSTRYGWLQRPIPQNLMPVMRLLSERTETGLSSGAGPVFIAFCVLVLQALESDHLEKLQARPEFTVFSHKDRSTSNSLKSCADSWPPEVHIYPRVSRSHGHSFRNSLRTWKSHNSDSVTDIIVRSNGQIQTQPIV